MADDPNRDILPVKDDSCYGSIRCFSDIDPRERHVVCKLDRYQLEDRYLRLLDEVQGLKKLSNSQEDKIKRLATKLMRSAASTRACPAALAINEDRERITRLELENARLKDKAYTLKNQLLSHRGPRSPSRCRRVASGMSSGPTTYRSDSARTKYQSQPRQGFEDNNSQNYQTKIEDLESEKNEMIKRIADLESQIAGHVAGIQREKVQDNVEYIRMWRQMKQANDKLVSVQATNEMLHAQIGDLKRLLEETTKNNREVTSALVAEKQRLSEIDEQITSAKDTQLSLREKEEQIRGLTNEMTILKQHNEELITLSSKFGQVEIENIELKRKVSEYAQDNQNLKSALNSEQADHAALRAANDQLMKKIEDLQKNMDNLTVQLMTFQNQGDERLVSKGTQSEIKYADKNIGTSLTPDSPLSSPSDENKELFSDYAADEPDADSGDVRKIKLSKKGSDPAGSRGHGKSTAPKSKATTSKKKMKNISESESESSSYPNTRAGVDHKPNPIPQTTSASMSREKMLKLLDQAQISTPLEAQNAARMRQIDAAGGQNDASIFPESYRNSPPLLQCLNVGLNSTGIPSTSGDKNDRSPEETTDSFFDPKQILLTLFEILQSYSEKIPKIAEDPCTCCDLQSRSAENFAHKIGENLKSKVTDFNRLENGRMNCSGKPCSILYEKLKSGCNTMEIADEEINEEQNPWQKFNETRCCTCTSNYKCHSTTSDCCYSCCIPETDPGLPLMGKRNFLCPNNSFVSKRGKFEDIGSTIQETFDSICTRRDSRCGCSTNRLDLRNRIKPENTNNRSMIDYGPSGNSPELQACKEILQAHYHLNSDCKQEKKITTCDKDCHTTNECGDTPRLSGSTIFPLLITKGQGLIEIHIVSLQLSSKARKMILKKNPHGVSIFISWDVCGQETAFTPILKYPSLSFNSSSVYRVCELQNFFDSVLREHIIFQVHLINPDEETSTVAKAKLNIKDILDYPQNKLHYVTPVLSTLSCSCGNNFGQLSLWIRLSCDIDLVENFKDRCGLVNRDLKTQPTVQPRKENVEPPVLVRKTVPKNSTPHNDLYSYPELTTAPVRDIMQETNDFYKNIELGQITTAKSNRLDTIRESALEQWQRQESDQVPVQKKNQRTEDADGEVSDEINNEHDDSPTTSNGTMEDDSQDSDDGKQDNTNAPFTRGLRMTALHKRLDSNQQIESASIREFNNVLKNKDNETSLGETGSGTTIRDLEKVIADEKWEEYKRSSVGGNSGSLQPKSADASYGSTHQSYDSGNGSSSKDTIIITIVAITFFDKTSLMNNPDIQLLYVEYSFLGMRGADMETASLPKPKNKGESMVYNFTRRFTIDDGYHISQKNMLTAMLSGTASPHIRFVIVSEPLPEDMDTKECVEVGYADLNIREYALGDGLRDVPLIIMNPSQSEQFGMLKITIDGIEIIRNCMMLQKRM